MSATYVNTNGTKTRKVAATGPVADRSSISFVRIVYYGTMDVKRVKITTTVPPQNADAVREALGRAGGGIVGNYSFCSFSVNGKGRFKPNEHAHPYVGKVGNLEVVEEEQIEITCERNVAKQVIEALKAIHPYEEPIIEITPLLSEEQL